jgi:hypothetical protein
MLVKATLAFFLDSLVLSPESSELEFGDIQCNQVTELEACYSNSKYLPIEERAGLSNRLKLSEQQIKTWFQNRRMKEKRQHKDGKLSCTFFV